MEENNLTQQNKLLGKTFFWMFLGLLGTAIVAWYTYSSGLFISIILEGYFNILLIVELIAVILFSFLFKKLPPVIVGILYFVYSMLNGVTLSTIFVVFELTSIVYLFVVSAIIFGVLGLIGFSVATFKIPNISSVPAFNAIAGESIDDIIIRFIKHKVNKKKIYISDTNLNAKEEEKVDGK